MARNDCYRVAMRVRLRAWGDSLDAVIPGHIVKELGLKKGQEVEISIRPATDTLFGKYPAGSAQKAKDEMGAGWDAGCRQP